MSEELDIAEIINDDHKFKFFVASSIISHGKDLVDLKSKVSAVQVNCAARANDCAPATGFNKKQIAAVIAGFTALLESLKAAVYHFMHLGPNGNN